MPDRVLRWGLTVLAALILALLAYFFIRLVGQSKDALSTFGLSFVFGNDWDVSRNIYHGAALVVGTLVTSAIALVIGVPVAIATALFIQELCPRRLRGPLSLLVDLLAAVPSVVYGLWGVFVLIPQAAAGREVVREHVLVHPLDRRRHRDRAQLLHRRTDPRDHDPADRLGDLA